MWLTSAVSFVELYKLLTFFDNWCIIIIPEPQIVYNGLLKIGVAITAVVIVKGAIAFAASLPTGGLSLTLLFV